jgi:8-oxo-dGTP pyrophosphatase MutT (NUDIX family)
MFAFDEAEFRLLARQRLLAVPPELHARSDDDLNPQSRIIPDNVRPREAAVLVPVVRREPELTLLLTQRTAHLKSHSGQVAFPGGKIDAADANVVAAALREAEEETGLSRDFVEPVGFLDGYLTGTAYHVVPVVALVQPGFALAPEPNEVVDVFEVPLRFLMSPGNHQRHSRLWQGRERFYYAMPYHDRYIWGATAGMIKNLYDRLYAEP